MTVYEHCIERAEQDERAARRNYGDIAHMSFVKSAEKWRKRAKRISVVDGSKELGALGLVLGQLPGWYA